jgi:PST family polysaccharide transporter
MDDLRNKTLSGIQWSTAGQVVRQVFLFGVDVVLARLLAPHDFGLMGMIVVITGFARLLSQMGLGTALVQKQNIEERHLSSIFWVNILIGLILTGVFLLSAPHLAAFYEEPRLRYITYALAFNFLIGAVNIVQYSLLQKKMDFKRLEIAQSIAIFLSGSSAVTYAALGGGVWSLVLRTIVYNAMFVLCIWSASTWRPKRIFRPDALRELMKFSLNLMGYRILNYWTRNLDYLLVGKFLGKWELGIYTIAYELMLFPVRQISGVLSRVMFSSLSHMQADKERVKRVYLKAIRSISLVTFPLMILVFVLADLAILLIIGEKWRPVIPILRIFCFVAMLQSIGTTVGWIYNSQGRTDIQFRWGLVTGAVYAAAFVIGLQWDILGVALAYAVAAYGILWIPGWTIVGRLVNMSFPEMAGHLGGTFLSAAAMGLCVQAVRRVLFPGMLSWTAFIVLFVSGILFYYALIRLLHIRAYRDVRALVIEKAGGRYSFIHRI